MDEPASFKSPQEEIAFLRKTLEDKQQELDEADRNFTDFQLFSKQLEDEMEQELRSAEKKAADLESKYKRLKDEYEKLLDKSSAQSKESSLLINTLQEELNKSTQQRISLQKDLRRVEQENDTLERRERMLSTSVADMQERLEKVMEENVWVQSELDEHHAQSNESVQRLRDEIRDLKLELAIMERKNATTPKNETPIPHLGKREHLSPAADVTIRPPKSPRRNATPSFNAPPIAIGMVSDMLNLVKELEVRIASYKNNRSLLSPPTSPRLVATDQTDLSKGVRLKLDFSNADHANGDKINNVHSNNTVANLDGDLRLCSSGSETDSEGESGDSNNIGKKGDKPTKMET